MLGKIRAEDRCDGAMGTIADVAALTCGKFAGICTFSRERRASARNAAGGG
jgi:hypothetical protein